VRYLAIAPPKLHVAADKKTKSAPLRAKWACGILNKI
jgi:hypothetical protein